MADLFNVAFLDNLKILVAAILIYALVFAILKKIQIFGDSGPVNSLIALMSAIIVSFSGVVTYSISYAINWFMIIIFVLLLSMILLMFLGVDASKIAEASTKNSKTIFFVFLALFAIIIIKSFFALNNSFDVNNEPNTSYNIDPTYNIGLNDVVDEENESFKDSLLGSIDPNILASSIFLIILGIFVFIIGN